MLTKNDLQAIKEIVDERLDSRLEEKFDKKLKPIKDDVENIKSDIEIIKKEIKPIKSMQRSIRKINKNVSTMLDMLNTDDMRLQKRVKRIEDHLDLPPQQT